MSSVLQGSDLEVTIKQLTSRLQEAIYIGNERVAKDLVGELSSYHLNLNIKVAEEQSGQQSRENPFKVMVHLEDRKASGTFFELYVRSTDTVADLKRKVWLNYKFPYSVQRWIIGKKIYEDKMPLSKCGIAGPGYTLYLYIVSAQSVGLTPENTRSGSGRFENGSDMSNTLSFEENGRGVSMLLMNENPQQTFPADQNQLIAPPIPPRIPYQDDENTEVLSLPSMSLMDMVLPAPKPNRPGWICPVCTYFNYPIRPGCEMCASDRPEGYVVPPGYVLSDAEIAFQAQQEETERMTRLNHEIALKEHYNQWLELDNLDLIPNTVEFTCPICFDVFEPDQGIVLRDCLHQFCQECLEGAITHSEEPIMKCPYQDGMESCDSTLQEREIRALVPEETFMKYLQRGLDQAESQAANSFHCKTANCKGWCVYEDEVNFFDCPICSKKNCLTCKVIHEGMNCKEYQSDLAIKAKNDVAARKTQELIEAMLNNGNAMHCPQCKIIVQKKDGCDWIKCSVCKTEICWVTKGPRWGPKGHGDTSGGCRCGLKGLCHPQCRNCH